MPSGMCGTVMSTTSYIWALSPPREPPMQRPSKPMPPICSALARRSHGAPDGRHEEVVPLPKLIEEGLAGGVAMSGGDQPIGAAAVWTMDHGVGRDIGDQGVQHHGHRRRGVGSGAE